MMMILHVLEIYHRAPDMIRPGQAFDRFSANFANYGSTQIWIRRDLWDGNCVSEGRWIEGESRASEVPLLYTESGRGRQKKKWGGEPGVQMGNEPEVETAWGRSSRGGEVYSLYGRTR